MKIGVLITDGGPHTSARWAEATAAQIVDMIEVDEKSSTPAAQATRRAKPRLELALVDALEGHHETIQLHERGKLEEHGALRYTHTLYASEHAPETLEAAEAAVVECAAATPFAAHFAQPAVRGVVRGILATHFNSVMHVERCWHRDRSGSQEPVHPHHIPPQPAVAA